MTDVTSNTENSTEEKEVFRNFTKEENGGLSCEVYDEATGMWLQFHAMVGDDAPTTKAVFAYARKNKIKRTDLELSPAIATRKIAYERIWRDTELNRVDVIINKIEDFELEGDAKAWRQYRVALRNWPSSPDFPTELSRPVAPTF